MRVLSTVAGTSALQPATALKSSLLPFKDAKADGTYYADIADALNAGNTAPFIYSGWENTVVTTGLKMLDFMKGNAAMEDVIRQLDEDQDSVVNNTPDVITTVTEELSQEDCAMLVGRCFAQATGSDLALVSLSTWIPGNPTEQNHHGVAAKLYAKDITDYDLSVILPTGWNRTIQTVSLTGQQGLPLCAGKPGAAGGGQDLSGGHLRCERPAGCGDHGHRQRRGGHGRRKSLLWRIHHHQPGRYRMELNRTDRRYRM